MPKSKYKKKPKKVTFNEPQVIYGTQAPNKKKKKKKKKGKKA